MKVEERNPNHLEEAWNLAEIPPPSAFFLTTKSKT